MFCSSSRDVWKSWHGSLCTIAALLRAPFRVTVLLARQLLKPFYPTTLFSACLSPSHAYSTWVLLLQRFCPTPSIALLPLPTRLPSSIRTFTQPGSRNRQKHGDTAYTCFLDSMPALWFFRLSFTRPAAALWTSLSVCLLHMLSWLQ